MEKFKNISPLRIEISDQETLIISKNDDELELLTIFKNEKRETTTKYNLKDGKIKTLYSDVLISN